MNRRASCVGTFEVFEAAHVALRTLLAFSQPVNCIFWPIGMLNWLVAASKLHKHRETCCTAEWPFYSFLILWRKYVQTTAPIPTNSLDGTVWWFKKLLHTHHCKIISWSEIGTIHSSIHGMYLPSSTFGGLQSFNPSRFKKACLCARFYCNFVSFNDVHEWTKKCLREK